MKQQLRKSLTEAFELRGTAPNTRATYEGCVDRFERHFGKSASRLGRKEVREFLLHLVERGLSASTHNVYAGALYFLYGQVLGRPGVMARLRFRKQPFKLPEVLTQREVERLLEALPSPRHRAIVMLAYGVGLRIGEVCQLCVGDIDSKVGVVHIRHAKRGRARDVMLSPRLLAELRSYYRWARPQGPELFPGRIGAGSTLTRAAVEKAVKKAREQAGLGDRRVTPHTLRHYAEDLIMPSDKLGSVARSVDLERNGWAHSA